MNMSQIECSKRWRKNNKEKYKAYNNQWKALNPAKVSLYVERSRRKRWLEGRQYVDSIKQSPCLDCKNSFSSVCMDFDHRDSVQKRYNVARMVGICSLETIKVEISKCDLVCSNCHRIRTFNRKKNL